MSDSRLPTGPDFTSNVRLPIGPDSTSAAGRSYARPYNALVMPPALMAIVLIFIVLFHCYYYYYVLFIHYVLLCILGHASSRDPYSFLFGSPARCVLGLVHYFIINSLWIPC